MNDSTTSHSSSRGQGFVFWLLLALGWIGLTPCVLLPEWRQYERLALAEQVEAYRLHELGRIVENARATSDALRDDPGVIARLAQRDLRFERSDERTIRVEAFDGFDATRTPHDDRLRRADLRWMPEEALAASAVSAPPLIESALALLPVLDYDAVFCDDRTRSIVMILSFGLMALAFVLFGRTRHDAVPPNRR